MGMSSIRVEWDPSGLSKAVRDSEVRSILLEKAEEIAAKNNAHALAKMHTRMNNLPYKADLRELKYTPVAVVHSTNRVAAAIGRKHGLPTK